MASPMFYRPNPKWQIWCAFAGAVLIHVGAVALAQRSAPPVIAQPGPADIEIITIDDPPPITPVEPPPEDIALPPPPNSDVTFIEENPSPPRIRQRPDRPTQRLVKSAPSASSMSMSSAKVLAISAPRLEYPFEARRQRTTGSGIAALTVDTASGYVTDVRMVHSTGSPILDDAAISGFRRWRFKAGSVSVVHAPITYTLTGAAF